jgi:hypothetical protein
MEKIIATNVNTSRSSHDTLTAVKIDKDKESC